MVSDDIYPVERRFNPKGILISLNVDRDNSKLGDEMSASVELTTSDDLIGVAEEVRNVELSSRNDPDLMDTKFAETSDRTTRHR